MATDSTSSLFDAQVTAKCGRCHIVVHTLRGWPGPVAACASCNVWTVHASDGTCKVVAPRAVNPYVLHEVVYTSENTFTGPSRPQAQSDMAERDWELLRARIDGLHHTLDEYREQYAKDKAWIKSLQQELIACQSKTPPASDTSLRYFIAERDAWQAQFEHLASDFKGRVPGFDLDGYRAAVIAYVDAEAAKACSV